MVVVEAHELITVFVLVTLRRETVDVEDMHNIFLGKGSTII